jgi:hypothetical protein
VTNRDYFEQLCAWLPKARAESTVEKEQRRKLYEKVWQKEG